MPQTLCTCALLGVRQSGKTSELAKRALEAALQSSKAIPQAQNTYVQASAHTTAQEATCNNEAHFSHGEAAASTHAPVLVVCATPQGTEKFYEALHSTADTPSTNTQAFKYIEVKTAIELAHEILREPFQKKYPGYDLHIMDRFDEHILFEDLRSTQFPQKRLHQVLTFLKAGWSRCADRDPNWLISTEEETLKNRVFDCLEFSRALLPCQMANFALKALDTHPELLACHNRQHVFVDNFHLIDKASQTLAAHLAQASFTFSSSTEPENPAYAEFPYFEGVQEYITSHPSTNVIHLHEPKPCASSAFFGETILHEMQQLTFACYEALQAGQSVMVVGENKLWRNNVCMNLEKLGMPYQKPNEEPFCKTLESTEAGKRITRAKLHALAQNPCRVAPWRSLLALGDYTGRSVAFELLRERALKQDKAVDTALRDLAAAQERAEGTQKPVEDSFGPGALQLVQAYREALCLLEQEKNEVRLAKSSTPAQNNTPAQANILVCSAQEALDRQADVVIFGCFVNGIIPCRAYFDAAGLVGTQKQREKQRCQQAVNSVLGSARKRLLLTGFKTAPLEYAERLGLKIERIKLKNGVRMCQLSESIFLPHK